MKYLILGVVFALTGCAGAGFKDGLSGCKVIDAETNGMLSMFGGVSNCSYICSKDAPKVNIRYNGKNCTVETKTE